MWMIGTRALISTLHDPKGSLGELARTNISQLREVVNMVEGYVVAKTSVTHPDTVKLLEKELGATVVEGGHYGTSRNNALKKALELNPDYVHCWDFDKLVHHLTDEPNELYEILASEPREDFVVVGRPKEVFNSYPISWRRYETHINNHYGNILGVPKIDVCSGMWIMSNKAASVIARESKEEGFGNCGEWPLIAWKYGFSVTERKARGLTWEDPERFEIEWGGGGREFENRVFETFTSAEEFGKRKAFKAEMKAVAERFTNNPERLE